jgi:5-methylcytosine-specific restriction enzyme A
VHAGYAGMTSQQIELNRFLRSAAWLKLRDVKLAETPWCEYCQENGREFVPAIDVDHVLPRHSHPELKLTKSNLKSACKSCHAKKTARGE